MAATANTAVSLSESYYLRSFYKSNRDAATASKRKELSSGKLSQADAEALRTAVRKLRNFDMDDDTDDGANIYASVSAFLETYNKKIISINYSVTHEGYNGAGIAQYCNHILLTYKG